MYKIYFADDPAGVTLPRGTHAYKWRGKKAGVKNPLAGYNLGHLASDRGEPEGGEKPSRPDSG